MNTQEQQIAESQLASLKDQEASHKQQIAQFEGLTKDGKDPHSSRLLERFKKILLGIQEEMKRLEEKLTTPTNKEKTKNETK